MRNFDVLTYFDERGVGYTTSGKNTTSGWINTSCMFCGDMSNHLGINLESKMYSCWKCGTKGSIFKIIQEIESCPKYVVFEIIRKYQTHGIQEKRQKVRSDVIKFPKEMSLKMEKKHRRFLESRRFDPDFVAHKYDLFFCPNYGNFKNRIIIPFHLQNKIMTFTTRATNDAVEIKYKHLPNNKSIIGVKELFYNIDSVKDSAIIVEGVFDAWRIGDGAIAMSGTKFTSEQLMLLEGLKNVFVLLDSDAVDKAHSLAYSIVGVDHIEVLELEDGDPADMSEDDVVHLRHELKI